MKKQNEFDEYFYIILVKTTKPHPYFRVWFIGKENIYNVILSNKTNEVDVCLSKSCE